LPDGQPVMTISSLEGEYANGIVLRSLFSQAISQAICPTGRLSPCPESTAVICEPNDKGDGKHGWTEEAADGDDRRR